MNSSRLLLSITLSFGLGLVACVTNQSTTSSDLTLTADVAGEVCRGPAEAGTTQVDPTPPPAPTDPTPDPTTTLDTFDVADVRAARYVVDHRDVAADGSVATDDLGDGEVIVYAGGPAPSAAVCAGACAAVGCGGYQFTGNITTGCHCYLTAGWKWCWDPSCNPLALAAGGAKCTAAACN